MLPSQAKTNCSTLWSKNGSVYVAIIFTTAKRITYAKAQQVDDQKRQQYGTHDQIKKQKEISQKQPTKGKKERLNDQIILSNWLRDAWQRHANTSAPSDLLGNLFLKGQVMTRKPGARVGVGQGRLMRVGGGVGLVYGISFCW